MKRFPNPTHGTSRCGARRVTLGGVLAVLLGAVTVLGSQGAAPAAAIAGQSDVAGLVDIGGGRRMYLECRGQGGPTVILVAGYGNRGSVWSAGHRTSHRGRPARRGCLHPRLRLRSPGDHRRLR